MHDDEFLPQSSTGLSLSTGTAGGLAGLLIGCSLLISACALMVFNVLLFSRGLRGIPIPLAQLGGVVGVGGVLVLGGVGLVSGVRGWVAAKRGGECIVLGTAGTWAALHGLIAWLIAGIDLLFILFS